MPNAYISRMRKRVNVISSTVSDRLWAQVQKSDGCWLWTGAKNSSGYGSMAGGQYRSTLVHRVVWQMTHGKLIPKGMCICHRCDVKLCVRPDHLFLGTYSDNQRDLVAKGGHFEARKTHCKRGHEFTPENTYHNPAKKPGHRSCYRCIKDRWLAQRKGNFNARKTHCVHGHEFTVDNTIRSADGARHCRTCNNARSLARHHRIRRSA